MDPDLLQARRLTCDAEFALRRSDTADALAALHQALFFARGIDNTAAREGTLREIQAVLSAVIAALHEEVAA